MCIRIPRRLEEGTGVTGSCELHHVDAGSQPLVLCKSSKCFYQLNHLSHTQVLGIQIYSSMPGFCGLFKSRNLTTYFDFFPSIHIWILLVSCLVE